MSIKVITAILLIVAIFPDLPNSYYQFLSWAVFIVALISAKFSFDDKSQVWLIVFVVMAIAFNPIAPVGFNSGTWQTLYVLSAIVFLIKGGVFNKWLK
ncbi:MAG: hypothetical protein MK193_11350 [Lentisphaeria bacterium]|nr:hypothetical protein [Lentisphaeria bacterium]